MKDNFSRNSEGYARYRPVYGTDMVEFIVSHVRNRLVAWDAGSGNGQLTSHLADYFEEVRATDISDQQLAHAIRKPNIIYTVSASEHTAFGNQQFDLVTVAQALHWFDCPRFFDEVRRVLKADGIFAAIGYNLSRVDGMDDLLREFYAQKVGPFWDPERQLLEQEYQAIAIPFEDLGLHHFRIVNNWTLDDLLGYLNTWSATRHYERTNGTNPVAELKERFQAQWGDATIKKVVTPVFVRLSRK